jgi:hypothetical protein
LLDCGTSIRNRWTNVAAMVQPTTGLPSLISRLERLQAVKGVLEIAAKLLPKIGRTDSAEILTTQITDLQREVSLQIDSVERTIEGFEDRFQVIAQFLLLNRHQIPGEDASQLQLLLQTLKPDDSDIQAQL